MKINVMTEFILYKVPVKNICLLFLLFIVAFNLFAKRLYFDIGIGTGYAETCSQNGMSFDQTFNDLDFGTKLGFLLNDKIILIADYQLVPSGETEFLIEIQDFWWYTIGVTNKFSFRNTLIGLGAIYYPLQRFQTSLSLGYTKIYLDIEDRQKDAYADTPFRKVAKADSPGIGFDATLAYDIPLGNFGALIGTRFFYSTDSDIVSSKFAFETKSIGMFVKFRY